MARLTDDEIIDMIQRPDSGQDQRERYYGIYFGLVEDNKDPLKLGRLKVRTPVHFDTRSIETNSLPWAHYAGPAGGDGNLGFYSIRRTLYDQGQ